MYVSISAGGNPGPPTKGNLPPVTGPAYGSDCARTSVTLMAGPSFRPAAAAVTSACARVGDGLLPRDAVRGSFGARRVTYGECARRVVLRELRDEGRHAVDLVALDGDLLISVERDDLLALRLVVGELRLELERAEDDVGILDAERARLGEDALHARLKLAGDIRPDRGADVDREREIALASAPADARFTGSDDAGWRRALGEHRRRLHRLRDRAGRVGGRPGDQADGDKPDCDEREHGFLERREHAKPPRRSSLRMWSPDERLRPRACRVVCIARAMSYRADRS